ncbi:acyl-CoA dehydrogenase family protein [Streptomyces sp. NPDC001980]|uniref:acyl-CoA dehydrogenase family protein n=1 Tax=Streptomyces sp. NPDC001980 TaxID=3157126 RepID=UPI00332F9980
MHVERERPSREVFELLGEAGLLTLSFGEDVGDGGPAYTVYLQVLEEIAARPAPARAADTPGDLRMAPR